MGQEIKKKKKKWNSFGFVSIWPFVTEFPKYARNYICYKNRILSHISTFYYAKCIFRFHASIQILFSNICRMGIVPRNIKTPFSRFSAWLAFKSTNSAKYARNTLYNDSSYLEHMPIKITTRATLKSFTTREWRRRDIPRKELSSTYVPEFRLSEMKWKNSKKEEEKCMKNKQLIRHPWWEYLKFSGNWLF